MARVKNYMIYINSGGAEDLDFDLRRLFAEPSRTHGNLSA
jgi:hypothetical protein